MPPGFVGFLIGFLLAMLTPSVLLLSGIAWQNNAMIIAGTIFIVLTLCATYVNWKNFD